MQRDEIKEMLLRRLATLSSHEDVIINSRSYRRVDLIQHVEKEDSIGQKMLEREARILKTLQTNNIWL
jgi:hypothetical protein